MRSKPEDIRLDTTRASSAGGQHANTNRFPASAIPANIPDHRHRRIALAAPEPVVAMQMLRRRIYDIERQKVEQSALAARKSQVRQPATAPSPSATYNSRKGRVTDHRINLTLYHWKVLSGEALDELIEG